MADMKANTSSCTRERRWKTPVSMHRSSKIPKFVSRALSLCHCLVDRERHLASFVHAGEAFEQPDGEEEGSMFLRRRRLGEVRWHVDARVTHLLVGSVHDPST